MTAAPKLATQPPHPVVIAAELAYTALARAGSLLGADPPVIPSMHAPNVAPGL